MHRFVSRLVVAALAAAVAGSTIAGGSVPAHSAEEVTESGLPYSETFADGLDGWVGIGSSTTAPWSSGSAEFDYVGVDNRTASSGSYLRPDTVIELPAAYRLRTSIRVDQLGTGGTVSLLTDTLAPYSATANNLAAQVTATGIRIAKPNAGSTICTGQSPLKLGEWAQVEVVRANGITTVRLDGALVAVVTAGPAGGTFALGAYKSAARFGGIGIEALAAAPAGHPTTATGCPWVPGTGVTVPQPIILNQTGFDLGAPKRFTAPHALDGEGFEVVDADDTVVFDGVLTGQVGDFTAFDPAATGPYRVRLDGQAGSGESYEFGIGADWTERVSYRNAVAFMSDTRCFFGAIADQPLNGTDPRCKTGLGWRDSHQLSFEIPALVDLYAANPSVIGDIRMPDAVYTGLQYPTAPDSPEIARLIAWGAELYLRGGYDHALIKEQLASFLWAYPEFSEWIPRALYDDVRDYLFPIWSQAEHSRYAWYDYTPHTADLLQVYRQKGTGKGEFPPGHSIVPNLRMWEVAQREGRADADVYRDAAIAQAQWLIENADVSDPTWTKGQRQGEYHLLTSLATLAASVPADDLPDGMAEALRAFAQEWADVVVSRSANMWDFRRYSETRWTIPTFTGGGSGEDPNETGNILGFPAAALAASTLLDNGPTKDRLAQIAQAHIDDVFGRNPTGRAATYRATDPELGFEGLDLGWFSEYQGGNGLLQGSHGVFDGSPKNAHYPFSPATANLGHTEGWVTFNTAWLESLAWRASTRTSISVGTTTAERDDMIDIVLRAPLNMDLAGGNTAEVWVEVDGVRGPSATVAQADVNGREYRGSLDLAALDLRPGDKVEVGYGVGPFEHSARIVVRGSGAQGGLPDWVVMGWPGHEARSN